jgi:hypothetical protein
MPILIDWLTSEKTVLLNSYIGAWTTADVAEAVEKDKRLIEDVGHPVPLILDMRSAGSTPSNLLAVSRKVDTELIPRLDVLILLGANGYIRSMQGLLRLVVPHTMQRVVFVDTMDEAVTVANRYLQARQ